MGVPYDIPHLPYCGPHAGNFADCRGCKDGGGLLSLEIQFPKVSRFIFGGRFFREAGGGNFYI